MATNDVNAATSAAVDGEVKEAVTLATIWVVVIVVLIALYLGMGITAAVFTSRLRGDSRYGMSTAFTVVGFVTFIPFFFIGGIVPYATKK